MRCPAGHGGLHTGQSEDGAHGETRPVPFYPASQEPCTWLRSVRAAWTLTGLPAKGLALGERVLRARGGRSRERRHWQ